MEHLSGKKEQRSQRDKRRSDKLKGKREVEKAPAAPKKPKTEQQKKWEKEKRQDQIESGRYGLPGAGRGTRIPSKKDKERNKKVNKKDLREAALKVASAQPEFASLLLRELRASLVAKKASIREAKRVFMKDMKDPTVVAAVNKVLPFFKGKPLKAAQYAADVLEESNFGREMRAMDIPMEDWEDVGAPAPHLIAHALDWSSFVMPFGALLVGKAGSPGWSGKLITTWVRTSPSLFQDA